MTDKPTYQQLKEFHDTIVFMLSERLNRKYNFGDDYIAKADAIVDDFWAEQDYRQWLEKVAGEC